MRRLLNFAFSVVVGAAFYHYCFHRMSISLIASLLVLTILESRLERTRVVMYFSYAFALIFVGAWFSLKMSQEMDLFSGFIQMGVYLLMTLVPLKWFISKDFIASLRQSLALIVILSLIAGLIQAAYLIGLQDTFYL